MAEEVTNQLMYEVLKDIRGTLKDHSEQFRLINQRLGTIEHHMAGFHMASVHHQEEISALQARIEKIERRLELTD